VALGSLNERHGLDMSMPSVMHIDPLINLIDQATLTPDKLDSLAELHRLRRRMNSLGERINRNRIASVNVVLEQYFQILSNTHVAERFRFARLPSNPSGTSLVYVTPGTADRPGAVVFDDIARTWLSASTCWRRSRCRIFTSFNRISTTRAGGSAMRNGVSP
jgi:hypothetical protein